MTKHMQEGKDNINIIYIKCIGMFQREIFGLTAEFLTSLASHHLLQSTAVKQKHEKKTFTRKENIKIC